MLPAIAIAIAIAIAAVLLFSSAVPFAPHGTFSFQNLLPASNST
jgi:hypothetical protein